MAEQGRRWGVVGAKRGEGREGRAGVRRGAAERQGACSRVGKREQ